MKYRLITTEGRAKRATVETVHGTIQTPVFMNVGTVGAIKGAVSTNDLKDIGTQVELSNTYHLHVRTGDKLIREMGGLHRFMNWDRPILTDSGGFQVFSLTDLRKIKEEGVYFHSHIDGRKIFMGPEESMQIGSISKTAWPAPPDGWQDARQRWKGLILCRIRLTGSSFCLQLIRAAFWMMCGLPMPKRLGL